MLSSCANPSCSSKFRYLHQGKLFLLQAKRNEQITTSRLDFAGHIDRVHYAWLCDRCSTKLEVVLDSEDQIKIRTRYGFTGLAVAILGSSSLDLVPILGLASEYFPLVA